MSVEKVVASVVVWAPVSLETFSNGQEVQGHLKDQVFWGLVVWENVGSYEKCLFLPHTSWLLT